MSLHTITNLSDEFPPFLAKALSLTRKEPQSSKKAIFKRSLKADFTFTISDAVSVLQNDPAEGADPHKKLQKFVEAHLLHFPENRRAATILGQKDNAILQPTSKGLAFLQKWFYVYGSKDMNSSFDRSIVVKALESEYNTMRLLSLERALLGRKILVSTGVVMLLWVHMMGTDPHIYDLSKLELTFGGPSTSDGENHFIYTGVDGKPGSGNASRALPSTEIFNPNFLNSKSVFGGRSKTDLQPSADLDLTSVSTGKSEINSDLLSPKASSISSAQTEKGPLEGTEYDDGSLNKKAKTAISLTRVDEEIKTVISPYYHRSMTHPNSTALMQYWDSRGIRLFKNVNFEQHPTKKLGKSQPFSVDLVFSGNALLQWVMDCTNVESLAEGISIATLIIENRLVKSVKGEVADLTAVPSYGSSRNLLIPAQLSTHALYRITPRGRHLCMWNDEIPQSILDPDDVQREINESSKRLNEAGPPVEMPNIDCLLHEKKEKESKSASQTRANLFDPDTWAWEHRLPNGVSQRFLKLVDFVLICREPALKMLFRENAIKSQCIENLMCADICQHLLLLLSVFQDASQTVTRRKLLEESIFKLLDDLEKNYLLEGSSLEVNISSAQRSALLKSFDRKQYANTVEYFERVEAPLGELKQSVTDLLRDAITQFANGESVYKVPGLRSYVVARHG